MMKKTIWILLDNRVGSRHQAEGVANYLNPQNFNVIKKEIEYTKLSALPNIIRGKALIGISQKSKNNLQQPFPDIVLSASRRTVPVARWIKKQNPQTKLIQLMHIGKTGIKDFSYIFVPEHDFHKTKAPNIYYTTGSPHFITPEKLSQAEDEWSDKFKNLPRPITALIIGGSIKKHPFTLENAEALAIATKNLKEKEGGSLLITTSRRTGAKAEELIMSHLNKIPHYAFLWGSKEQNPYLGYLACSDNLIVTGDSVSMCCEATASKKPLRIFTGKSWLTPKHIRFIESLYKEGFACDLLSEEQSFNSTNKQLNIAQEIAQIISKI